MTRRSGRHFLQIAGPTNVPGRILRAMDRPPLDHRGPEFGAMSRDLLKGLKGVFRAGGPLAIYPASGSGALEAALVNTLSPGDRVLMIETGYFALRWGQLARRLGLQVDWIAGDWRHGADPDAVEARLAEDRAGKIKAVCLVHNETSTGVTSRLADLRAAIDRAGHPALLLVDAISSLASMDYRHDAWGVDVTVAASQKGLMLPPGLSFNAISERALKAAEQARMPRGYWSWSDMLAASNAGYFPYTPATSLLYGLREAIAMLFEEGLENVFARHHRLAEATRRAVRAWGLDLVGVDPREYSNSVTAVLMPGWHDADAFRKAVLKAYDMSLGNGLGKLAGKAFRIGHMGDLNDLMLAGTLAGVEMGLVVAGVPHAKGGVQAALDFLAGEDRVDKRLTAGRGSRSKPRSRPTRASLRRAEQLRQPPREEQREREEGSDAEMAQ